MQRITKRNEQGGIEIDGLTLALERLAEYEDIGSPEDFLNYQMFYEQTMALPNCNDCGDRYSCCIRRPSHENFVTWNCPLWTPENEPEKEPEEEPEEEPHEIEAHTLKEWDHIFGKDKRHGSEGD